MYAALTDTLEVRVTHRDVPDGLLVQLSNGKQGTNYDIKTRRGLIEQVKRYPHLKEEPEVTAHYAAGMKDTPPFLRLTLTDPAVRETIACEIMYAKEMPVLSWLRYDKPDVGSELVVLQVLKVTMHAVEKGCVVLQLQNRAAQVSYTIGVEDKGMSYFKSNPDLQPQAEAVMTVVDLDAQRWFDWTFTAGGIEEALYRVHGIIEEGKVMACFAQWRHDGKTLAQGGNFVEVQKESTRKSHMLRANTPIEKIDPDWVYRGFSIPKECNP